MIKAACHCGAVRLTVTPAPVWVLDCNCSICRRTGALWAYSRDILAQTTLEMRLLQGADKLETYLWNDREIGFCRCKACGCLTHHVAMETPNAIRGVNARMFVGFDPESVTIYRSDNAHTGFFWTRPDEPIWPGAQPPVPVPGPEDWR
jgi:hypothetical protein